MQLFRIEFVNMEDVPLNSNICFNELDLTQLFENKCVIDVEEGLESPLPDLVIPDPKIKLLDSPRYYLALVTIFRDEARFLKEWIEFYKLMGVEHFYLYNNLSKDNYLQVLEPYIKDGIVDLFQCDAEYTRLDQWHYTQNNIYSLTVAMVADSVEWLLVCDSDEFLFPLRLNSIPEVLKKYDGYPALAVNWHVFGAGDVKKIEDNELLIERLNMGANCIHDHVKTLVKPRYVETYQNPHFPILKYEYTIINENYELFDMVVNPSANILVINHYWSRDQDFFYSTKIARRALHKQPIEDLIAWNNLSSIEYNNNIFRFIPDLRKAMFP
jgi:hypothetical protein